MMKTAFALLISLALGVVTVPVHSQTATPEALGERYDERYDLDGFVEQAVQNGGAKKIESAKIAQAEARLSEARGYSLWQGSVTALGAPIPGASGDSVQGRTLWDDWNVLSRIQVELVQPIYTFGALDSARRAAQAGVDAQVKLGERAYWQTRKEIAELYYGYQLAFEFHEFSTDIASKLEQAVSEGKSLRSRKARRAPSQLDLDKLRVFLAEAKIKQHEAEKAKEQIILGMSWKIGYRLDQKPKWNYSNLKRRQIEFRSFDQLFDLMRRSRPELVALEKNVEARRELVDVQTAQRWPQFFVGGQATWSHSHRTDQTSPFAYDPFNDVSAAIGIGLRLNLDFGARNAKISQSRADLLLAESEAQYYSLGIEADFRRSYSEMNKMEEIANESEQSERLAKRVFQDSMIGFEMGNVDARSLLEALSLYVNARKNLLETRFQYNRSLADLERSIGAKL